MENCNQPNQTNSLNSRSLVINKNQFKKNKFKKLVQDSFKRFDAAKLKYFSDNGIKATEPEDIRFDQSSKFAIQHNRDKAVNELRRAYKRADESFRGIYDAKVNTKVRTAIEILLSLKKK